MFGLIGSRQREAAIEALRVALTDPQHRATRELVQTLALLEIQSNPQFQLRPYDEKGKDAWLKQRDAKTAAYNKVVAEQLNRIAGAMDSKSGQARAVTINTLLTEVSDVSTFLFRWLVPSLEQTAKEVLVAHESDPSK